MPKSAANFTSGGASSNFTSSGNRSALLKARPLSSLIPAGSVSFAVASAGSGALKVTSLIVAFFLSSSSNVGAIDLPSAKVSRIAAAWLIGTGAVKRTYAGCTGLHPACGLVRLHSKRAANGLRTVKSNRWSVPASLPEADAIALPHTSAMSRPGGSARRHFRAVIPA